MLLVQDMGYPAVMVVHDGQVRIRLLSQLQNLPSGFTSIAGECPTCIAKEGMHRPTNLKSMCKTITPPPEHLGPFLSRSSPKHRNHVLATHPAPGVRVNYCFKDAIVQWQGLFALRPKGAYQGSHLPASGFVENL